MFAPSNRPQTGPRHHSTESVAILSPTSAQSLLSGLRTPHASEFRFRPTYSLSTTAPSADDLPQGLGLHFQPVTRPAPPTLPPFGFPSEPPILPSLPAQTDLFSPASVYSSNSPESNLYTSPSTDSLPSPSSAHDADDDRHNELDARAWSRTPDWLDDDDTYDSPVWASRWTQRNESTLSDSLWGSHADGHIGGGGSSLFSLNHGAGPKDVLEASFGGRRSSTGSSLGGHFTHGMFLPMPPRPYSRQQSESSVGSLFRFSGPAASITTRSASPPPLIDGDGWDDLSSAISDEVLGIHHDLPELGEHSFGSFDTATQYGSFDTRGSCDSTFQFDGPNSLRRPSGDSLLAPKPSAHMSHLTAPVVNNGSLYPVPANAGAELLYRRNSAGSFTDYQIRRASFERRSSIGSHPLVASVDSRVSPETDEGSSEAFPHLAIPPHAGPSSSRRESSHSELEREIRLSFLMDLDRRVSQVVEVQAGGRLYAADQWDIEPSAIQSVWSPSTAASETPDRLDQEPSSAFRLPAEQPVTEQDDDAGSNDSPSSSGVTASPSNFYSTLHANISLTFSFEERLSPLTKTLVLPPGIVSPQVDSPKAASPQVDGNSLFKEYPLPDLSPRPLVSTNLLASAGRPPASYFEGLHEKRTTGSFLAFDADDSDVSDAESDLDCGSRLSVVEIATGRRVELQVAAGSQTPPPKGTAVFDHSTPRPIRVRNMSAFADADDDEDMVYLAQMVRVLPTPQSSPTPAAGRRESQHALIVDEAADKLDLSAFGFPRSVSNTSKSSTGRFDKPLPRPPKITRLRGAQSSPATTPDGSASSSSSSRRMASYLSANERPTSAISSSRSVSPFTPLAAGQERRFSRGPRQSGAWEPAWGGQLARSSVVSPTTSRSSSRPTSYISRARTAAPSAADDPFDFSPRKPSAALSLPVAEDVFVQQVDTKVKRRAAISDSPTARPRAVSPKLKQQERQRKPLPKLPHQQSDTERRSPVLLQERQQTPEVCHCPLFFQRVDGRRVPVAHPMHPPPPLPPTNHIRPDPILSPTASARSTIHDPRRSPIRFAVPQKAAPAPFRPPMASRGVQSESVVSRDDSGQLQSSSPDIKKRRSRAVLSRLFTKREKPIST